MVDDAALAPAPAGSTSWCPDRRPPDVWVAVRMPGLRVATHAAAHTLSPRWDEAIASGDVAGYRAGMILTVRARCGAQSRLAGTVRFRPPSVAVNGDDGLRLPRFGDVRSVRLHFEPDTTYAAGSAYTGVYIDGYLDGTAGGLMWDGIPADGGWGDGEYVSDGSGDLGGDLGSAWDSGGDPGAGSSDPGSSDGSGSSGDGTTDTSSSPLTAAPPARRPAGVRPLGAPGR